MDEDNMQRLNEVLEKGFEELKMHPVGSEEYEKGAQSLERLCKLQLEEAKNELAANEQMIKEDLEQRKMKNDQSEKKKQFYLDILKVGIGVAAGIGATMWKNQWMNALLEFEKEGTITNFTTRNFIPRFNK